VFITANNNKYKIGALDTIHIKKRHTTELRHIIEMLSMGIKHFCCINADCYREMLETKVYVSYTVCCHNNDHAAAITFVMYDSFTNYSAKNGNYYYGSKNGLFKQ